MRHAVKVRNQLDGKQALEARLAETEERLHHMADRYQLATTAAMVGVWDWDIRSGDFYLDPNVKALLGYRDDEIPNDLDVWAGYVHPDDREAVMRAAQDVIDGKSPQYAFEHRMLHKDGSVRWFMVRGRVVRNDNGEPVRFVGTDTDITERRLLEEAVSQLAARAQTRIGHDLHDSLAQELAGLGFLLKSLEQRLSDTGSALAEDARKAYELSDRAISMTQALAAGLSPILGEFGLLGGLHKLADHARALYRVECDVVLEENGSGGPSKECANELYRIAQEAITNAVRHGGATRVVMTGSTSGSQFVLTVTDNGVGIGDSAGTGGGMGVRIMNYRARSMGGSLSIGDLPGGGAVVRCVCPLPGRSESSLRGISDDSNPAGR